MQRFLENWKTALAGLIVILLVVAKNFGVSIPDIGNLDMWTGLIMGGGLMLAKSTKTE